MPEGGYYQTLLQGLQHTVGPALQTRRLADMEHRQAVEQQMQALRFLQSEKFRTASMNRSNLELMNLLRHQGVTEANARTAIELHIKNMEQAQKRFEERMKRPSLGPTEELMDAKGNIHQVRVDSHGQGMFDARTGAKLPSELEGQLRKPMPMPLAARQELEKTSAALAGHVSLLKSFKPEYAGYVVPEVGKAVAVARAHIPGLSSEMPNWWKNQAALMGVPLTQMVGGRTLTAREQALANRINVDPSLKPDDIISFLNQRIGLLHGGLSRQMRSAVTRYHPQEIESAAGQPMPSSEAGAQKAYGLDELTKRGARISGVGRPSLEELLGSEPQ